MNPEAKEVLSKIVEKTPAELTVEEVDFLYARRSYLTKAQTEEFKDVLNQKAQQVQQGVQSEQAKKEEPRVEEKTKKA